MRKASIAAGLAATVLAVAGSGCGPPSAAELANLGTPPLRSEMLVTTKWLAAHLDDPNLVVVEVGRFRAGYEAGHVPGARYVAWDEIALTRHGLPDEMPALEALTRLLRRLGIDQTSRIVLYDDEGGLPAARAYAMFDYLRLGDRTALLDGHWKKWKTEKRTTSFAEPVVKPTKFVPRLNLGVIVHLAAMRELVRQKTAEPLAPVAIIDARPAPQYTGAQPGEGITRPGHIPGAVNVFSGRNLVSENNPVLRPAKELRGIYQLAGAEPGKTVLTYCRTGGEGSLAYFTAKYLGYDVRLYDGSFWEWSRTKDTPVARGQR